MIRRLHVVAFAAICAAGGLLSSECRALRPLRAQGLTPPDDDAGILPRQVAMTDVPCATPTETWGDISPSEDRTMKSQAFRIAGIALAALLANQYFAAPATAAENGVQAACGQDLQQFCTGVQPGGGRLIRCLVQQPSTSPVCRAFLQQARNQQGMGRQGAFGSPQNGGGAAVAQQRNGGAGTAVRAACGQDLQQSCAGVQPGGGRLIQCLARQPNLSAACNSFMAQRRQQRLGGQGAPDQQGNMGAQPSAASPAAGAGPTGLTGSLTVGGQQRSYLIEGAPSPNPRPTIIMLHGSGGSAQGVARGSGLAARAQQNGFVAVFPEGMARTWNDGRPEHAQLFGARGELGNDIAFLRSLVADLVRRGIADPQRVYLAGFSAGGFMTYRMACDAADLFAAVATFEANMPEAYGGSCRPDAPLPLLAFSGTADPRVHYEGGQGRQGAVWSTDRTVSLFRRVNGCGEASTQTQLPSPEPQATGVTVIRWTQCVAAPVVLYRIEGGVHRIPASNFAAEALWTFFRDKARGGAAGAPPVSRAAENQSGAEMAAVSPAAPGPDAGGQPVGITEEVTFQSNGYTLHGCIIRPDGPGPFPAVIYNHGSDKEPARCGPKALERAYVEHGYLVFAFHRHGHGLSPGEYIGDLTRKIRAEVQNPAQQQQQVIALHDLYNRDVVGAVQWLMQRPEVDRNRMVMTGVSYGGIQTLLTAEKGLGLRAFIPFAPGAMSWRNQALQRRLEQATRNAKAPMFLAQAQNDYNLGPSEVLGPIVRANGAPNEAKIYPAFGTTHQQGHAGFAVRGGVPIWSPDVFAFLDRVLGDSKVATPR